MADPPNQRAVLHQAQRVERLSERLDGQAERIDDGFNRIENRLDGLARAVAEGGTERTTMLREMMEIKRDVGELRDRTASVEATVNQSAADTRHSTGVAVAVAASAAADAKAVAALSVQSAVKKFWDTSTGKIVKWSAGVAGVGAAVTALPAIIKFLERVWSALRTAG